MRQDGILGVVYHSITKKGVKESIVQPLKGKQFREADWIEAVPFHPDWIYVVMKQDMFSFTITQKTSSTLSILILQELARV